MLRRIDNLFETPMVILGILWLVLLVVELVHGLNAFLEKTGLVIWGLFIIDFLIKLIIAPVKNRFLRKNILTIISLIVPALRVFRVIRVLRFARLTRSARLVKVIGSLNRGMRALASTMERRAFGYVLVLTILVLLIGAAGMFAFEKEHGLDSYSNALWWTAMILTTMGSEYWPRTAEGRVLCIILALYAFAVFGYVTATIATYFIGQDVRDEQSSGPTREIRQLRRELREIKEMLEKDR